MTRDEYTAAGGPAFPTMGYAPGMTLRDHFAGLAMQGAIGDHPEAGTHAGERGPAMLAAFAYRVADAMLAARSPKSEGQS